MQIYVLFSVISMILIIIPFVTIIIFSIRASHNIHEKMINNLLQAPLYPFHDQNPTGRIINRISRDLYSLDLDLPFNALQLLISSSNYVINFFTCIIFDFWSLIVLPFAILIFRYYYNYYIQISSQLTRLQAKSKSPILQKMQESLYGRTTISLFGNDIPFIDKFNEIVNTYSKISIHKFGSLGFFGLRISLFSLLIYIAIIMIVLFQINYLSTSTLVSISIIYAYSLASYVSGFYTDFSTLELNLVSLERCLAYSNLPKESVDKLKEDERNSSIQGKIEFQNYSTKYRPEWPLVLRDFSLEINEKEKIRIIGRTGSGKSTIFLTLLGMLKPTSGSLLIGGIDISSINGDQLRRSISIIPQEPSIFMGNLKENLDPKNLYSDEEINNVLKITRLNKLIEGDVMKFQIEEQGRNLSLGQKQLISFGRAILKKSKIILMDEVTSAMDLDTELVITSIMSSIFKETTIITISHKMNILSNYHKIVILDNGKVSKIVYPSS